jgi:hypothetical protein
VKTEEGYRELSRVKRDEQRELNWSWGEDVWMYWSRISERVNMENNRVSPTKESFGRNSELKSKT